MYYFPNSEPVNFSISNSKCFFFICIQFSEETGKVVCVFNNFAQFIVIYQTNALAQLMKQKLFENSSVFFIIQ